MPGRISKETRDQREKILEDLIASGITIAADLAREVQNMPEFSHCRTYHGCHEFILRFLRRRTLSGETDQLNHKQDVFDKIPRIQKPALTGFDEIINRVTAKIPPSSMGEVDKFFRVLRPEWQKLESAAKRVAELEQQVAEYEKHVCPDADEKLRQKNEDLQRENTRLQLRVDTLSRSTGAHVSSEHLVVHSRG